jgi:hypothetical protein
MASPGLNFALKIKYVTGFNGQNKAKGVHTKNFGIDHPEFNSFTTLNGFLLMSQKETNGVITEDLRVTPMMPL